jgi:hypothetical protein
MTARGLARIFARERRRFGLPRVGLQLDQAEPRPRRAMAYTDGRRVTLYARALELPRPNLLGLVRHELGHALLLMGGRPDHTERDADRLAEAVTGRPIRYDCRGVQTTGRGRRPRPRGLR